MSKVYTVRPGDSLYRIAARLNTTVGALARKNGIAKGELNKLSIGQRLKVDSFESKPSVRTRRVSSGGETTTAITQRSRISTGRENSVSVDQFRSRGR